MRKSVLTALAACAALCVGALAVPRAEAMTAGAAAGLGIAADAIDATETVQYIYGGQRHCWYPSGWHGPGWYWCGYRWRRGYGWGGPAGWQGWHYGPPPAVRRPPPPGYRPPPPHGYRPPPPHGPAVIVR